MAYIDLKLDFFPCLSSVFVSCIQISYCIKHRITLTLMQYKPSHKHRRVCRFVYITSRTRVRKTTRSSLQTQCNFRAAHVIRNFTLVCSLCSLYLHKQGLFYSYNMVAKITGESVCWCEIRVLKYNDPVKTMKVLCGGNDSRAAFNVMMATSQLFTTNKSLLWHSRIPLCLWLLVWWYIGLHMVHAYAACIWCSEVIFFKAHWSE